VTGSVTKETGWNILLDFENQKKILLDPKVIPSLLKFNGQERASFNGEVSYLRLIRTIGSYFMIIKHLSPLPYLHVGGSNAS
jgi:hypothetical protein